MMKPAPVTRKEKDKGTGYDRIIGEVAVMTVSIEGDLLFIYIGTTERKKE